MQPVARNKNFGARPYFLDISLESLVEQLHYISKDAKVSLLLFKSILHYVFDAVELNFVNSTHSRATKLDPVYYLSVSIRCGRI